MNFTVCLQVRPFQNFVLNLPYQGSAKTVTTSLRKFDHRNVWSFYSQNQALFEQTSTSVPSISCYSLKEKAFLIHSNLMKTEKVKKKTICITNSKTVLKFADI